MRSLQRPSTVEIFAYLTIHQYTLSDLILVVLSVPGDSEEWLHLAMHDFAEDLTKNAAHTWAMKHAQGIYTSQVQVLSHIDTGFHFSASNATAQELQCFNITGLAGEMYKQAPDIWQLIQSCLSADAWLAKRRAAHAYKSDDDMDISLDSEEIEGEDQH
ncbi:hypothetical protein BDQ17DRAFT_1437222 [Cyathus striatus]|nr:hypothetical protein BDQ17DRAFT_1437222 [Cyathus striatus]